MSDKEIYIKIIFDEKEAVQSLKITEEQFEKLKNTLTKFLQQTENTSKALGKNKKNIDDQKDGIKTLGLAFSQIGYILNDAQVFLISFRMGLMGISNNLPIVISLLAKAKEEINAVGGSISKGLVAALSGPGGLMLAINGVMLLLNILPSLFSNTTKEIKNQKTEVDKLSESYAKLTREQIKSRIETYEKQLQELEAKKSKEIIAPPPFGISTLGHPTYYPREKVKVDEERIKTLNEQIKALKEVNKDLGIQEDVENRIRLNREKLEKMNENPESKNYWKKLVPEAKDYNNARELLNKWIEADRKIFKEDKADLKTNKVFEEKQKQLQIQQDYLIEVAKLEGKSDLEILQMKQEHLQQMLDLYRKYGEDVTELNYKINLNLKEQEILGKPPEIPIEEPEEPEPMKDAKYIDEMELQRLKIQSIEDEWERKRQLADWELQMNLKKYEDYENYEIIKTELLKQHSLARREIDREEALLKLNTLQSSLTAIQGLFAEHTAAYKAIAIFNAIVNTYQAAIAAYKSAAELPLVGYIIAPVAAASATAFGLGQVANIEKTQVPGYKKGGFGIVGEEGIEVIAPLRDYAQGQAALVNQTLYYLERQIMQGRLPISNGSIDNSLLSKNLESMNNAINEIKDWQRNIQFTIYGEDLVNVKNKVENRKSRFEY